MILNPQDALVMRGHPIDVIVKGLIPLLIAKRSKSLFNSNGCVQAIIRDETTVPAFNLPIKVLDTQGRPHYFVDLRKTSTREYRLSDGDTTYIPTPGTEAQFQTHLALAMKVWQDGLAEFAGVYFNATRIYALWIASRLTKRLVLDPAKQNELTILFAYFFITRTVREKRISEQQYDQFVNKISQLFGYRPPEVYTVLDPLERMIPENIQALCQFIATYDDNPKLNKFNQVLLQTVLIGSWFGGPNVKELIAIAVEYPPAFLTLVYRGLSERTYKDTDIAQLANRLLRAQDQKSYTMQFASTLARAAQI